VSRNPASFTTCDTCLQEYVLRRDDTGRNCSKVKIFFLILRDLLVLMVLIQAVLWALAGFLYLIDMEGDLSSVLHADDWPTVAVVYVGALLIALMIVGLIGCCGSLCWMFGLCVGRCQEVDERSYPYRGSGFWYYYFLCYCPPSPHYHSSSTQSSLSGVSGGGCVGCGGGDCKGDGIGTILAVIAIVLIVLGIIFSLIFLVGATIIIVQKHLTVLQKRDAAAEMVVVDLSREPAVAV